MLVTAIAVTVLSFSIPAFSWDKRNLPPSTVDKTLVISNGKVAPDGFTRVGVLAGSPQGTFPGPAIRATKGRGGSRYRLNVVDVLFNKTMVRSTSIHWHGIFQHQTNWADGVSFVTQCPIIPGEAFSYDFTVPEQVGTYWYHSHLSTQYCDGLRGAFVIYDPEDPYQHDYDIDDENTIITLADWYHVPAATDEPTAPLVPISTLINGKGRYVKGPATPLSVVNVKQGKRYRFRLVGMMCDTSFVFSIDSHDFTIIEADGEYTQKLTVDSLEIFAGQRYSVILNANKPVGNYWIRANPVRGFPGFDGGRNSAILRYEGAPKKDPTSAISLRNPLKEVNLHSKFEQQAPGKPRPDGADVNIHFNQKFNFTSLLFEMNGVPFINPTVPVLLQILSGTQKAQDLLPKGSVYSLPPNKVIEISISGTGIEEGGPHPFHLHGHSFWVVRSGDSKTYNYKNPVRRDTVSTGLADGNATFRFVTDNAGPWFLHCHIDFHLELGLAIVFAEDIKGTKKENPVPPAWKTLCPIYDRLAPEEPKR